MNLIELGQLTEDEARTYLETIIWPNGPVCPHCGHTHVVKIQGQTSRDGLYSCSKCRREFTVTVDTILHGSHLPIKTWLMAFYLMCSSKKGVSALQLQRNLGIKTYKTAWKLSHTIRKAMKENDSFSKLFGEVEVDETYVGGKDKDGKRGRGSKKKTPIVGLAQRKGKVKTQPVDHVDADTLKAIILDNVRSDAHILTDEWPAYRGVGIHFDGGHDVVNHGSGEYVRGNISTNWIESYWSLLKKGIGGIFHHISKQHLASYCNEFNFRWNYRKISDGERFDKALLGIIRA
jgi:transposase-like protein